jgi:NADPH-dependent 2,4-dienoyl-CoA reductase/sulfur reductase-like enzyme
VIVGNGVAGIEAALAIKLREPSWRVTVVSEESDHFFSRTALMWVAIGQMSHEDIEPYERDLYERAKLERVRARAVGIDTEARLIRLARNAEALSYDRLVIACGSAPRPLPFPGESLRGVGHFVTLSDLEWLERELFGDPVRARPPRPDAHDDGTALDSPYRFREPAAEKRGRPLEHAVVIGGGLIGIEVVEVLLAAKKKVSFLIRDRHYWSMAIDERESAWIAGRLRDHGADVRLGETVEALVGDADGNVAKVRTDQGEIATDAVIVAVGVVPNTGWLGGSSITLDEHGGIVVDASLATSVPSVWAAGDCASVPFHDGSHRPEQLWYTARAQGRVAARAVLGDDVRYERGTWFNSAKLADIEYTTVGLVNQALEGEESFFHEEKGPVKSTTRIVTVDGRVVGMNLLGRRWDHSVLVRFIEERRSLEYVLSHLFEASFDTEFVPPLVIETNY